MSKSETHQYDPVRPSDEEKHAEMPESEPDSESDPFLSPRQSIRVSKLTRSLPWVLCILFASLSSVLLFFFYREHSELEQYRKIRRQNEFSMLISIKLCQQQH